MIHLIEFSLISSLNFFIYAAYISVCIQFCFYTSFSVKNIFDKFKTIFINNIFNAKTNTILTVLSFVIS